MHNKSVLLYGNTGTGKTTLAKFIAHTLRVNVVEISATYLYSKNSKSPEETVNKLFKSAIDKSPSVILLDEIDILCPSRNGRIVEAEKRIISTMLARMDELSQIAAKVFIIATTNKIDQIEPAFRRCGRLDREIEIPTPNPKARKLILRKILSAMSQKVSEAELQEIAMTAHGYVGADLVSVCSQASLLSSRRSVPKIDLDDLKAALRKVRPSAMREVQIETPNVKWTDIGGHSKMKALLSQSVEWPLKYPESFKRLGISPPKGVLMFGPPGCSKTMIAKALATESGLNFITIKGSELFSKWVGESEKAIRDVFRKARQVAPSVVFFDEIDALAGERSSDATTSVQERVLAQLLTELDGITPLADVNILAATNRPDRIDKALIRPGRIDRAVYVALPDADVRRDIFRIQFLKMPTEGVSVEMLVEATQGYSGAEITGICKEAAMFALSEDIQSKCVRMEHFDMALKLAPPRTPPELLKIYDNFVIGAK
uniref:AAA+ ATPase domain-containing protein n=1 Tax=Dendroctonus ponderosae TaxID=77166 RepID=A0AAR5PKZ8_DENPD